ncbi:MAG: DUF86 domain-containing protein [Deltaproteobacteria bacterium]|nr:DUF86 domain-containing protein [Deltaproteobacteria bacterium]
MTDVELVLLKLSRLRDFVQLARSRRPPSAEQLEADLERRDALALAVLVAAQEAVDVAYHVASDEGWGLPDSHGAAFDLLVAHGVLDVEIANAVRQVVRVRNRIAHGYASIDHARIWHELPEGLDALERYAAAVARWLPPITTDGESS